MKVVLVRPPTVMGEMAQSALQHPLNLLYLAAVLEDHGCDVSVWDLEVEPCIPESIEDRLLDERPAILGFTAMTPHINWVGETAEEAKRVLPEVLTIVGGPHASALPERTLEEFPAIDAVVFGEGELTLCEVIDRVSRGDSLRSVSGLAHRANGEIVRETHRPMIEELNSLPFPARHLLRLDAYSAAAVPGLSQDFLRITQILTSRGCPYGCTFCASHHTLGRKLRLRSAQNVIEEVRTCRDRFGFDHFSISDDQFTMDRERTRALLQGFRDLGVSWDCDARVDLVDGDLLREMAESGCSKVGFGVEAGSPRILNLLRKGITVDQAETAFGEARRAGLMTAAYFMIGSHPLETEQDVWASIDLAKRLRADFATFSVAVPLPGTSLYEMMREEDLITATDWRRFSYYHGTPAWSTVEISAERLVELQRRALRSFFFSPGYILGKVGRLTKRGQWKYWLKGGIALLRYLWRERSRGRGSPH
jgi:radical SAM superfamily enzyme YgiQ (UPF0313 family)